MHELAKWLLASRKALKEEDFEALLQAMERAAEVSPAGLSAREAEACLRVLDEMVAEASSSALKVKSALVELEWLKRSLVTLLKEFQLLVLRPEILKDGTGHFRVSE